MKSSSQNKRSSGPPLKPILAVLLMIMLPWGLYYNFHTSSSPAASPQQNVLSTPLKASPQQNVLSAPLMTSPQQNVLSTPLTAPKGVSIHSAQSNIAVTREPVKATVISEPNGPSLHHRSHAEAGGDFDIDTISMIAHERATRKLPVLGEPPTNGTKPVFGKHTGRDAIFALACKYPKSFYVRFVGTLRKFGYADDIVLAVSPPDQMKPGVLEYVQETNVVAYAFDVDCAGKDNCRLRKDFLGSVIFC
jgi:hypothetical protein